MFGITKRLAEKGVRMDDIIPAATALYLLHGIDAKEAAKRLERATGAALEKELGALLPEDERYDTRENVKINDDPVFLLSDEIIGIAIAGCTSRRYSETCG